MFEPREEALGQHLKTRVDEALATGSYTHIAIVDADVIVPDDFWTLPDKYPSADIIGTEIVPSSRIYRLWEKTYWAKLKPRIRDCATIYSTIFLNRVEWPLSETPGTILQMKAHVMIHSAVKVIHVQSFSLRHSVKIQLRDGKSRAEIGYPFWKTLLHGVFRLRPVVLYAYTMAKAKNARFVKRVNRWLSWVLEE